MSPETAQVLSTTIPAGIAAFASVYAARKARQANRNVSENHYKDRKNPTLPDRLDTAVQVLTARFDGAQSAMNIRFDGLENRLEGVRASLASVSERVTGIERQMLEHDRSLTRAQGQDVLHDQALEDHERRLDRIEGRLTS